MCGIGQDGRRYIFRQSLRAVNAPAATIADVLAFKASQLVATARHLNMLLGADGSVAALKGKGGHWRGGASVLPCGRTRAIHVSAQRQSEILGVVAN